MTPFLKFSSHQLRLDHALTDTVPATSANGKMPHSFSFLWISCFQVGAFGSFLALTAVYQVVLRRRFSAALRPVHTLILVAL